MKEVVKKFKENKNKESYDSILKEYVKDHKRCRICDGPIYYYDSFFRLSKKGEIYPEYKSYLTFKEVENQKYYLSCCEDCLTEKYPEYQNKNKSKVFNMMNEISAYAFDIPEESWKNWKNKNYTRTLQNYIEKFGEIEGDKRWKKYCDKQAISNSFEYKKEKHGWDETKFREFNKSRAVTLNNLIKKHGEEKGLIIWNKYIDRQRYTCTKEYFVKEYGEKEGMEKYTNFANSRCFSEHPYSKVSQKFFENLDKKLNKYETYYATKNKEWVISHENGWYNIDYFIKDLNIGIEFNGDIWHANPKRFKPDEKPLPFMELTSKEIWEKEEKRTNYLNKKLKDLIIIWEKDYYELGEYILIQSIIDRLEKIKNDK